MIINYGSTFVLLNNIAIKYLLRLTSELAVLNLANPVFIKHIKFLQYFQNSVVLLIGLGGPHARIKVTRSRQIVNIQGQSVLVSFKKMLALNFLLVMVTCSLIWRTRHFIFLYFVFLKPRCVI